MLSIPLFALILGLLHGAKTGCPLKCNCTDNSVACISKSLEYVPYFESLSNNPVIIDLSGNSISNIDIDDFSFDKSDQVKEIYLNGSTISMIEEKSFEELENLQELYLADNLLNDIPPDFITKNGDLILLDMSRNHFVEMPTIFSTSLEVLALANSGISNIPSDALDGLPTLKILLLQENNLVYVDPAIFEITTTLSFVNMAHNPWKCDCKTVKLFNYLTIKNLTELPEPVQCRNVDLIFVEIFDDNGVTAAFQPQCDNYVIDDQFRALNEMMVKSLDNDNDFRKPYSLTKDSKVLEVEVVREKSEQEILESNLIYWYLLIFIAIPLSLILGGVIGSCVTYRHMVAQNNRYKFVNCKEVLVRKEGFL